MRSPGGATDASPAPRDAFEPDADARVERSPALDANGHAAGSPPRKGTRGRERCGVHAGAAPASAADVAETRAADAPPLGFRAGADDDRAAEPGTRESERRAATAKNPVPPGAPEDAASEPPAIVDAVERGRSPATPTISLARRDRARAVSPPTASDASAGAPTSGPLGREEGSERSETAPTREAKKQTASAPAWIEPPTAPSFDAGRRAVETRAADVVEAPAARGGDRANARGDEERATIDDASSGDDASEVASEVASDVAATRASDASSPTAARSIAADSNDSGTPFPSGDARATDATPTDVVSVSAYDGKRAQRVVLVPENKVGLVLGRGGAHAAYFQHQSGAAIHVARDPGEVPGLGITIFEVPPASSDEEEDEEDDGGGGGGGAAWRETRRAVFSHKKPAVDAAHRRRIHLLGSEPATATAAAMIARLVQTSSHRLDRVARSERLRKRRIRDRESDARRAETALPLSTAIAGPTPRGFGSRDAYGRATTSLLPIGFADDVDRIASAANDDADASNEPPATCQETMRVPHARVGLIIGRRGENIRFLQDLTRAHIQVQPERDVAPGQTHRPVTLRGAADAVAEARRAIEDMCAGKTRIGSAGVTPPQPFAVTDFSRGASGFAEKASSSFASGPHRGNAHDASGWPYGSHVYGSRAYGSTNGDVAYSTTEGSFAYPAAPWCAGNAATDAYAYYAYASPHGPYAYAPPAQYAYDPYAYAPPFVDPRFPGFAYVPGSVPRSVPGGFAEGFTGGVPGTSPGTPPDVPRAAREPPAHVPGDAPPGTLPPETFPTPGEWYRDSRETTQTVVPPVSKMQPGVEFPADDAANAGGVGVAATASRDGDRLEHDATARSSRRRPASGERRRGGKHRRERKERAASARSARSDAVYSATPAVTVSFPKSPEPSVGTGVFRVDPPHA